MAPASALLGANLYSKFWKFYIIYSHLQIRFKLHRGRIHAIIIQDVPVIFFYTIFLQRKKYTSIMLRYLCFSNKTISYYVFYGSLDLQNVKMIRRSNIKMILLKDISTYKIKLKICCAYHIFINTYSKLETSFSSS